MRILSKLAVTTVAAASLLFGTAVAPASAATVPAIDVTSIKVTPSNGSSGTNSATKYYDVRTSVKLGDVSRFGPYWSAEVSADVYRGSTRVARSVDLGYIDSSGYKSLDSYIAAKTSWGRGDFKVKNVRVAVDDYNSATSNVTLKDASYSRGTFKMRSVIDGKLKYDSAIRVSSKGSAKTVKIGIRKYHTTGWKAYSGAKVKIQYKTSSGWKTRKTVTLDSKGLKTYKFKTSHKYKYRLSISSTTTVLGGTTTPSSRI